MILTGKKNKIYVGDAYVKDPLDPVNSGPTTDAAIGQSREASLAVDSRSAEAVFMGESWAKSARTLKSWRVSVRGAYDFSDAGQQKVSDSIVGGNAFVTVTFSIDDTPGNRKAFYGVAEASQVGVDASADGISGFQFEFQGLGDLHYIEGFFQNGAYGIMSGDTFSSLESKTFSQLETQSDS